MLKTEASGSLIFRLCGYYMVVMRSVGGTYGTGGRLLSCPFSHLESFNPLGALRVVLILACCQLINKYILKIYNLHYQDCRHKIFLNALPNCIAWLPLATDCCLTGDWPDAS
jgi:hypothetical protein